ncbi:MAG: Rieske 2Fe-2S domain-containing protein, partial [Anaerolineae bacterium]|nr:Rieske 2Fe-2S domain-containing protein [Anaerolineae bacterium]
MSDTGSPTVKEGAEDAGRYFKYMAEFVGFTEADAGMIRQSKPLIEKHLPNIVAQFYAHLLRYPPTRKFFLKKDGTIDQEYVELRMRHLTNFWLRTASGVFDDDYARYVDYVGRAHTSRGADPSIYIAERYVIGQMGMVQHAISEILSRELRDRDDESEFRAVEAWDKLLMVILELLARAYGHEREAETFAPLLPVDHSLVGRLAAQAFAQEYDQAAPARVKDVVVAVATEIPVGGRKIVQVGSLSIGVFHHKEQWYALRNHCLHRGGPVATGSLSGDTLVCPWHGFEYNVMNGQCLDDPNANLEMYPVTVQGGQVHLQIPALPEEAEQPGRAATSQPETKPMLKPNEFRPAEIPPGHVSIVQLDGEAVAVHNVEGTFYATQNACTHRQGSLSDGDLQGRVITCPLHGSQFDVTTGQVLRGPAAKPLRLFRVTVDGGIGRVEPR